MDDKQAKEHSLLNSPLNYLNAAISKSSEAVINTKS